MVNHKQDFLDNNNLNNNKVAYSAVHHKQVADYLDNNHRHNNNKECLEDLEPPNHNNKEIFSVNNNLLLLHKVLEEGFLDQHNNNHNNNKLGLVLDNKHNNLQHQVLEGVPYSDSHNKHNSNNKQVSDSEVDSWVNQLQLVSLVIK